MRSIQAIGRTRLFPLNESKPPVVYPYWCDTQEKRQAYRNYQIDQMVRDRTISETLAEVMKKETVL